MTDRHEHPLTEARAKSLLVELFAEAVAAADPEKVLARFLPERPAGRCVVVGAGKAATKMARAVERAWPDVALSGAVVTPYGHALPTERVAVLEAAHPVPDAASEAGARRLLDAVTGLGKDDLVLALMSGGGSSLLALPAPGLTLADKQAVNRLLLSSGLGIAEMNRVRRRLSAIKGGKLAAAARPARIVTLAVSDVPGDDPLSIASGPTLADPEADIDLSALADRLGPGLPEAARALLCRAAPPPEPLESDFRLIATPMAALDRAAALARSRGWGVLILGDALEGEAREMGRVLAGIARSVRRHGHPLTAPAILLSGGETGVTIAPGAAPGRGGRNTECLLSLAVALAGEPGIFALAADTDGIDGTQDAAGAFLGPETLAHGRAAGLDARALLDAHDSYRFFKAIGDLVVTGPTLTNVNDFRAVLIEGPACFLPGGASPKNPLP